MIIHDLTPGLTEQQNTLTPLDPRAGRKLTHRGLDWRVFLDPYNWPWPRLVVLSVFEEYGRYIGAPSCRIVPALGQGWFGPYYRDVHIAFANAILQFARERTGIDYHHNDGLIHDINALYAETRPFVDNPREPLFDKSDRAKYGDHRWDTPPLRWQNLRGAA